MHYCIGDVHGCYDELIALIDIIESRDPDANLIFLGDFCDRGPKVWETVNWVVEHISDTGKYRSIQGNHEQMVLQWFLAWSDWYKKRSIKERLFPMSEHINEPKTYYDFYDVAKAHRILKPDRLAPFMSAFLNMPFHLSIEVPGASAPVIYDIAHAWYDPECPEDSVEQQRTNLWARNCDGNFKSNHIIIHGHTPTITEAYAYDKDTAPGMIAYRRNAINLDGGCVFHSIAPEFPCMLCAICLETLEEIYPMSLEDRMGQEKASSYRRNYLSTQSPFRHRMLSLLPEA